MIYTEIYFYHGDCFKSTVLPLKTGPAVLKCKAWNIGKSAKILSITDYKFDFWEQAPSITEHSRHKTEPE